MIEQIVEHPQGRRDSGVEEDWERLRCTGVGHCADGRCDRQWAEPYFAAVAILEGRVGETDIAMGVPQYLAEKGLARVIELLDAQEQAMSDHSADQVARDIAEMKAL